MIILASYTYDVLSEPTVPSIVKEMNDMAGQLRTPVEITARFIPGALEVLRAGEEHRYNEIIADEAERLIQQESVDTVALAMFSMACAGPTVQSRVGDSVPVLTSPEAAVEALRGILM